MKAKLIELQKKLMKTTKTIERIRLNDEKQYIGINQIEVEIENINNELLRLIQDMKDE